MASARRLLGVGCTCSRRLVHRRTTRSASTSAKRGDDVQALLRQAMRKTAQPVAVVTAAISPPPPHHHPLSTSSSSPPSSSIELYESSARHNHGATLSSLSSVSLSPPLIAFSLRLPSRLASYLLSRAPSVNSNAFNSPPSGMEGGGDTAKRKTFRVSLLSASQESVARAFARQVPPAAPTPATSCPTPSTPHSPPVTSPLSAPPHDSFAPELFDELERDALGSLECTLVQSLPLHEFGERDGDGDGGASASASASARSQAGSIEGGGEQRSELFLARVDDVRLGTSDEGSLVYWEQQYKSIRN